MHQLRPLLGLWMVLLGCIAFLAQPSTGQAGVQQVQQKQEPTPHTIPRPAAASLHATNFPVHWPPVIDHYAPELASRPAAAPTHSHGPSEEEHIISSTRHQSSRQLQPDLSVGATAARATCITNTRRSAMRIFLPATVQAASSQSTPSNRTLPVIIQLAAPADGELQQLINGTGCGQNYSCLLTAAPPTAVIPGSIETLGSSTAKVLVAVPAANQTEQKIVLAVPPDPCNLLSTQTDLYVEMATAAPNVRSMCLSHAGCKHEHARKPHMTCSQGMTQAMISD